MQLSHIALALVGISAAVLLLSDRKDLSAELGLDGLFDFAGSLDASQRFDPSQPETLLTREALGERLRSPGMALAGGRVALASDALSFFETEPAGATPARIVPLADLPGCAFRAPRPGELIGNVHVGTGGVATSVLALSRSAAAEMTRDWVRAQQGRDAIAPPEESGEDRLMRVVDVIVTERSAPIYLILQSGTGNVIWNIQKSPAARIAAIAVVAAGEAGIAGIEAGTPVEVLRTARNPDCAVRPARQPAGAAGDPGTGDASRGGDDAYLAYDRWFRETFRQPSEQDLVGYEQVSHVLIGPVPAPYEKIAQTRLDGAVVALTAADYSFVGSAEERRAALGDLIVGLATAAAGGDLALLQPGPERRGE